MANSAAACQNRKPERDGNFKRVVRVWTTKLTGGKGILCYLIVNLILLAVLPCKVGGMHSQKLTGCGRKWVPFVPLIDMDSQRQQRFARLIQKEVSEIFQREMGHQLGGAMVSVNHVTVSPDLAIASLYLSFVAAKDEKKLMEDILELNKVVRNLLGKRIKNQARVIPELRFFADNTAEEAAKMEALLASLHIPPADGDAK